MISLSFSAIRSYSKVFYEYDGFCMGLFFCFTVNRHFKLEKKLYQQLQLSTMIFISNTDNLFLYSMKRCARISILYCILHKYLNVFILLKLHVVNSQIPKLNMFPYCLVSIFLLMKHFKKEKVVIKVLKRFYTKSVVIALD